MTTTRDFKALIRARMEKTGERYLAARRHVLDQARRHTATSLHTARAVLRQGGTFTVTDQMARAGLDNWRQEIMARYGNRNFRVP